MTDMTTPDLGTDPAHASLGVGWLHAGSPGVLAQTGLLSCACHVG